jgi:hypothetical protein
MIAGLDKLPALLRAAREVAARTGKSVARQGAEIRRLRRGAGRLRPEDYYAYHVYDDTRYPGRAKDDVVSWRFAVLAGLNHPLWRGIADDKLLTYALLGSYGIPVPPVRAVYDPRGRRCGATPSVERGEQVAAFLRALDHPVFGKPVAGSLGIGASSIDRYDGDADELVLAHGRRIGIDAFLEAHVLPERFGYLFQDRVVPHPELVPITANAISTLRMVVLNGAERAVLYRAVWKLAIGDQITDNYRGGTSGNLKAWVDRNDGEVRAAFLGGGARTGRRRIGPDTLGRFVDRHPDTGREMVGIRIPDWERAVQLVLDAARHFPGLRYQSWDLALGDSGPTVLELNARGLPQQVPGFPGMLDDDLRAFASREREQIVLERNFYEKRRRAADILRLLA